MKSLIAAFVLVLLAGSVSASISYTLNKPTGSNIDGTLTAPLQLHWGLSYQIKVTPVYTDLLSGNATNNNNTDLRYTFVSSPGALVFSPSSITFRVTVNSGAADPVGSTDVTFTPAEQLVTFWPVNMDASANDPIWSFNYTLGTSFAPVGEHIALNWTEDCFLAGTSTPCTSMTSASASITDFVEPQLRPLILNFGDADSLYTDSWALSPSHFVKAFLPSPPVLVNLPLQDGAETSFTVDRLLQGSTSGDAVRMFTPGRDNAGGTLTVSIYSVWRVYDNGTVDIREQVTGLVSMIPASVTIDANTPAGAFQFNADIPWSVTVGGIEYDVSYYAVFFSVVETSSTPSLNADAGFPQGAYSMITLNLQLDTIDFYFVEFDFDTIPISPRKTGSYRYHVAVDNSPLDLGMGPTGTITYPFTVTPAGAITVLVASTNDPTSFVPVTEFVWTGAQRVIEFIVNTQDAPSGPLRVTWNFSDPIFAPPRALQAFGLLSSPVVFDIVPNTFYVSPTNDGGRIEDGITPGQPFYLQFEWTPPTTNGFTITLQANGVQYPDGTSGGNYTVTIGAGMSALATGPFFALEQTNLDNTFDDVTIVPINIGTAPLPGSSDNTWFNVETPLFITVRRDRVYLLNTPHSRVLSEILLKRDSIPIGTNDYSVYELAVGGFPSEEFCFGVSLNSQFFSNGQQEIWVTPWCESIDVTDPAAPEFRNRSGLIFTPVNNPAAATGVSRDGMPPGTVVLSRANNGTGCFTIAFDRSWPFLSWPLSTGMEMMDDLSDDQLGLWSAITTNAIGFWRVQAAIGGPNTGLVFERDQDEHSHVLRMPDYFTVRRPTIQWQIMQSEFDLDENEFLAGESTLIYISLSEPAQFGLNYALTCTACVFEQVNVTLLNGTPGFAPGSVGPHLWRVSIQASPLPFEIPDKRVLEYDQFVTTLSFWSYGPDAAFYGQPPSTELFVQPRSVEIETVTGELVPIGLPGGPFKVELSFPVLSDLTLVPVPIGDGGALVFDPPQIVFTPDSPHVQFFSVSVDSDVAPFEFGAWRWMWELRGTDANITVPSSSALSTIHSILIIRRPAPAIMSSMTEDDWVAGITYGPFDISVLVAPLLGEDEGLTLTPSGAGIVFTPPSITLLPGQFQQVFSARWEPQAEAPQNGVHRIFWSMSGPHAWKYSNPADLTFDINVQLRTMQLRLSENTIVTTAGVPQTAWIELPMPTPNSVSVTLSGHDITFNPSTVTFTAGGGRIQYFTYTPNKDASSDSVFVERGTDGHSVFLLILGELSGPDVPYYEPFEGNVIYRLRHYFEWDLNEEGVQNPWLNNDPVFMLNHPSPVYTISVSSAPQDSVTMTFESEYLEFSPASLTFGPGVLTQSFSFTPIAIPATQIMSANETMSLLDAVNVILSGPDADLFDPINIEEAFEAIMIIPEIDISPIAPIFTDGASEGDIHVSIKDAGRLASGLPAEVGAYNAFTIHIIPEVHVYIEPSVVEFSSATTGALRSFTISHPIPHVFSDVDSYDMRYYIKFAGNHAFQMFEITPYVPLHARKVLLKRYNIIPQFPKVLSYGWQEASFNLTRSNAAHMALVPVMPLVDGLDQDAHGYGSHATAGGRVQFDPAVIVFAPGQMVQSFMVKAERGIRSGAESVYYRVEWEMVGNEDDLANYIEWRAVRSDETFDNVFSTWHVAGALSLAQISVALVTLAVTVLLAL